MALDVNTRMSARTASCERGKPLVDLLFIFAVATNLIATVLLGSSTTEQQEVRRNSGKHVRVTHIGLGFALEFRIALLYCRYAVSRSIFEAYQGSTTQR
jgi:hypothetical protein